MPLVTLTVRKPKSPSFKSAALAAVHRGLIAIGVPEKDLFQRVLELEAEDFRYDDTYPDLTSPRNADFILVEILFSVGRSVKVKRKVIEVILAGLARDVDANPENVMIVFKETAWENWAFGGGRILHG